MSEHDHVVYDDVTKKDGEWTQRIFCGDPDGVKFEEKFRTPGTQPETWTQQCAEFLLTHPDLTGSTHLEPKDNSEEDDAADKLEEERIKQEAADEIGGWR